MNGVNLIPESRRLAKHRRVRIRGWTMGCAAYAIVLIAVCTGVRATFSPRSDRIVADRAEAAKQITELDGQVTATRARLTEVKVKLQTIRLVTSQPDWSILLAALGNAMGDDAVLNTISLEPLHGSTAVAASVPGKGSGKAPVPESSGQPTQWRLDLQGHSLSQPSVSKLISRLQQTGLFQDITLQRTRREPFFGGQAIAFQMQCLLGEKRSSR
jgi:Tfp pilus assembly protein PilN